MRQKSQNSTSTGRPRCLSIRSGATLSHGRSGGKMGAGISAGTRIGGARHASIAANSPPLHPQLPPPGVVECRAGIAMPVASMIQEGTLKKLVTIGLAVVAVLAAAAVAVAQVAEPVIQPSGAVAPTKGGTKKKPKNAKLKVAFSVNKESRKTLSGINFFVPANVKLSGKGFKYC